MLLIVRCLALASVMLMWAICRASRCYAQEKVERGITVYRPDRFYNGYTLFCHSYENPRTDTEDGLGHIHLIDMEGNNIIQRGTLNLDNPNLYPVAREFDQPLIDSLETIKFPGDTIVFYFKIRDASVYGVLESGINNVDGYITDLGASNSDTLAPFDFNWNDNMTSLPGANAFLKFFDYDMSGSYQVSIIAEDNAGNNNFLSFEYNIPVGNSILETYLYPSPWSKSEPLYLQYYLGDDGTFSDIDLRIFNLNGDYICTLYSDQNWDELIGPGSYGSAGAHRCRIDASELSNLPNGTYFVLPFDPASKKEINLGKKLKLNVIQGF